MNRKEIYTDSYTLLTAPIMSLTEYFDGVDTCSAPDSFFNEKMTYCALLRKWVNKLAAAGISNLAEVLALEELNRSPRIEAGIAEGDYYGILDWCKGKLGKLRLPASQFPRYQARHFASFVKAPLVEVLLYEASRPGANDKTSFFVAAALSYFQRAGMKQVGELLVFTSEEEISKVLVDAGCKQDVADYYSGCWYAFISQLSVPGNYSEILAPFRPHELEDSVAA